MTMCRVLLVSALAIWVLAAGVSSAAELKVNSDLLSATPLPQPEDQAGREYLGIVKGDTFTLGQVRTEVLIVEVFSMYCPHCQAEAPKINKLYHQLQGDPKLKDRIRMVGVGTGNTPFEVKVFKDKFGVPFPLVPDEEFGMEKATGEKLRTPTFIVAKADGRGGLSILFTHVGPVDDYSLLLKKAGER
ncbi:MAG: redoxin family protein [Pseudomonadota bacterium]